jgi:hypothetical protein
VVETLQIGKTSSTSPTLAGEGAQRQGLAHLPPSKDDRLTELAPRYRVELGDWHEEWRTGRTMMAMNTDARSMSWRHGPNRAIGLVRLPWGGKIYLTGSIFHYDSGQHDQARGGEKRWIDNKILALSPSDAWRTLGELPRPLSSPAAAVIGDRLDLGGGSSNGATPQPAMSARSAP